MHEGPTLCEEGVSFAGCAIVGSGEGCFEMRPGRSSNIYDRLLANHCHQVPLAVQIANLCKVSM